jgi:hypothetical protein
MSSIVCNSLSYFREPLFRIVPAFVLGGLLLGSIQSCSDRTGDDEAKPQKPVDQPAAPEEIPLSPQPMPEAFALAEDHAVIAEPSGGGPRDVAEFLRTEDGAAALAHAGVEVTVVPMAPESGAEGLKLSLTRDLVLSFATMGVAEHLAIETNGNRLVLIGDEIKDVAIRSTAGGQPAGDVLVIVRTSVSGTFDLRGAPGVNGADGACPPGFESCARTDNLAFPVATLAPQVRFGERIEDSSDVGAFSDILGIGGFSVPAPKFKQQGACGDIILRKKPEVRSWPEGVVRKTHRWPEVSWPKDQAALRGRDGWLSPGNPGTPGQPGGSLTVYAHPEANVSTVYLGDGGAAGKTGNQGVVGPAPAPTAEVVQADETTVLTSEGAAMLHHYKAFWSVRTSSRLFSCTIETPSEATVRRDPAHTRVELGSERKFFFPPSTEAGRAAPVVPEPTPANAGRDGAILRVNLQDLSPKEALEVDIPVPSSW